MWLFRQKLWKHIKKFTLEKFCRNAPFGGKWYKCNYVMFHRFRQGVWRHIWNVTLNNPNATNGTLQLSRKFPLFWLWSGHHLHPSTRGFPRHLLPASSLFVQRLTFFVKVRQNYIRRRLKVICLQEEKIFNLFPKEKSFTNQTERQFESILQPSQCQQWTKEQ